MRRRPFFFHEAKRGEAILRDFSPFSIPVNDFLIRLISAAKIWPASCEAPDELLIVVPNWDTQVESSGHERHRGSLRHKDDQCGPDYQSGASVTRYGRRSARIPFRIPGDLCSTGCPSRASGISLGQPCTVCGAGSCQRQPCIGYPGSGGDCLSHHPALPDRFADRLPDLPLRLKGKCGWAINNPLRRRPCAGLIRQ